MKKFKYFAYVGAIALLSVTGFTSCSSSDGVADSVEPSPNYNPETNEVYTQFVFNVASGSQSGMRQTADATQASTNLSADKFRGIEQSHVMCFIQGTDGKSLATPTTAAKDYDMARVAAAGTMSNSNSRRVLEMSLPLNTNTMLFYGRAIPETNYNAYGHLDDYTVAADLTTVNFKLGRRLTADQKTQFQEIQKLLATVLTCIINTNRGTAAVAATDTPGDGIPAYGFDIAAGDVPNLAWSAYVGTKSPVTPSMDITQLELKLGNAYKEMTSIQEAELRNASGYALKMTIQDLWSIVNAVRCATPTTKEEAIAKYMAHLISQHLTKYFGYSGLPKTGASVTGVAFASASDIISSIGEDTYWPASAGEKPASGDFSHVNTTSAVDLGRFPEQFNLPQGATHITFDGITKAFSYVENYNSSAVGGDPFTVDDYYYPAELLYFGNSPLRVSNVEHVVADYPASVTAWDADASWTSGGWTTPGHVESSTRSVAMKNDINYGSSLLKTTVSYGASTLLDNNKAIQQRDYGVTEDDKAIEVDGTSFKLVGVIVGGQWPKVGWNFLPQTTTSDPNYRQGYIFDVNITSNGVVPATGTSAPNYTLVFDNYNPNADNNGAQDKVFIALEFENNTGTSFFGKDNLIHDGGHFYLIGELDPAGKNAPTWPTHHALPPYNTDGTSIQTPRVFMQDYVTTANFKIGENSLKKAYLTVPDLRSSSVTLGLSVDVKWETGLIFDDIILGGE